jgi:hypothetical protein
LPTKAKSTTQLFEAKLSLRVCNGSWLIALTVIPASAHIVLIASATCISSWAPPSMISTSRPPSCCTSSFALAWS